jgi:uncharacterized protein (DUF2235 family)
MSKNIVICLDGTGNEFGPENSNVVKLVQVLQRDTATQVAYYHPGVGTLKGRKLRWICGLAFGVGLGRNTRNAYSYLMDAYRSGDRVFIFGFSRGAYTARVLAGMLYKVGLLEAGAQGHLPYAWNMFCGTKNDALALAFRRTFARKVPIHFVGVWDTVSSVGWIYNPITFPYTARNPWIRVFRHAVSTDERRTHFRTNLFNPGANQDCKQVWFPGVHSDIGGGYPEPESGLAKIALKWMVDEAAAHGLLVDPARYAEIVEGRSKGGKFAPPDCKAQLHDSLTGWWRIAEHLPRRYIEFRDGEYQARWAWAPFKGFYQPRWMPPRSLVHPQLLERMKQVAGYVPVNLVPDAQVETPASPPFSVSSPIEIAVDEAEAPPARN